MKKLAVLSNINIDPLKNFLAENSSLNLYFAGYNQWQTEMMQPVSGLFNFAPHFVFLHLDAEELKNEINDVYIAVENLLSFLPKTRIIISDFILPPYSVDTYLNTNKTETDNLNKNLSSFAQKHRAVFILGFQRLVLLHGYNQLFSHKFWYLGRIKFSNAGFRVLANELFNTINCLDNASKKLLALDLDNTLWGGIAGEDGWNNIKVSADGVGKIYADFQRNILKLAKTGILLAIVSKNNESDIDEVFERNKNLQISPTDFIIRKINWKNKSENLLEIASELNIGTDAIVFIDDNPFERQLISEQLPEIAVPDFPEDVTELNYWFINKVVYPYFAKKSLTAEDIDKKDQYKRNAQRATESKLYSFNDFLNRLNIKIEIYNVEKELVNRISQLTQKTNQFNLSAKRYSESELAEMMKKPGFKLCALNYEDKFGNEGITGAAIITIDDCVAFLDTFLLSCRILGRKAEDRFMDYLIIKLKELNISTLHATYTDNGKNSQVCGFLENYGFKNTGNNIYIYQINKS